jgi:hypothetical protein
LDRERCHQAAIAVTLLEEPFPIEGLPGYPVQQVGINLRTDHFHKVARQAVASRCVYVQNTHTGIETESSGCPPSLGFEQRIEIEIVENCVPVSGETREPKQRQCSGTGSS